MLSAFLKLDTPLVLILFDNNLANDMSLDDIELAIVRSKFCHELDLSCQSTHFCKYMVSFFFWSILLF